MLINSADDLLGFLTAGFVFRKLLSRKKFIFLWAFGITIIGLIGCMITGDTLEAR